MKNFKEFVNESVNDKHALLDILREWGVFNPLEFMRYLEEIGYTIIELDPVGTNESINYEDGDLYDISDEEELEEVLDFGNIDSLDRFTEELGYVIIKKDEVMNEYGEYGELDAIDVFKDRFKKKINPTLIQSIQKLGNYMHEVDTNGMRANMSVSSTMTDKEQYEHVVKYAYNLKKAIHGIIKLENKIKRITKKRRLTEDEQEWFDRYVNWVIRDGHYRYPRKFSGFLSEFDQEELDKVVDRFNSLVDRYHGKKIYPIKNEKV